MLNMTTLRIGLDSTSHPLGWCWSITQYISRAALQLVIILPHYLFHQFIFIHIIFRNMTKFVKCLQKSPYILCLLQFSNLITLHKMERQDLLACSLDEHKIGPILLVLQYILTNHPLILYCRILPGIEIEFTGCNSWSFYTWNNICTLFYSLHILKDHLEWLCNPIQNTVSPQ